MSMIQAEIYDFDGLIVDTETPEFISWQEQFQNHGADLDIEKWVEMYVGIGSADITVSPIELLQLLAVTPCDADTTRSKRRLRYSELLTNLPLKPGVTYRLQDAKRRGVKLAIASSSSEDWIAGHLSRLKILDLFDEICSCDHVKRTKPDPEVYMLALRKLHVNACNALAYEDSPRGAEAAVSAGLNTIAVPSGITANVQFHNVALVVPSLDDTRIDELISRF